MKFTATLALCLVICQALAGPIRSICPDKDLVSPCTCEDNKIYCTGPYDKTQKNINEHDLEQVFDRLSKSLAKDQKHFQYVTIGGTEVKQIGENFFGDLTFDQIFIGSNFNLTHINPNAFRATASVTKWLDLVWNTALLQPTQQYQTLLTSFTDLEFLRFEHANMTQLGHSLDNMTKLKQLHVHEFNFTLETNVLKGLKSLEVMDINEVFDLTLKDNAFHFDDKSVKPLNLTINIYEVKNTDQVFSVNSLVDINRDVNLVIYAKHLPNSSVLQSFRDQNPKNTLLLKVENIPL